MCVCVCVCVCTCVCVRERERERECMLVLKSPHHLSPGETPLAGCAASDQEQKGQGSNGGTLSGWEGATGVLQGRRDVCEWVASCVASEQLLV